METFKTNILINFFMTKRVGKDFFYEPGYCSILILGLNLLIFLIFFSGMWTEIIGSGAITFFLGALFILPILSILLGIIASLKKQKRMIGVIGIILSAVFLIFFQRFFFI